MAISRDRLLAGDNPVLVVKSCPPGQGQEDSLLACSLAFGYDSPAMDAAARTGSLMERRTFLALVSGGLLAVPIAAEAQRLFYEGRVQWIAGSTLILATDEGWTLRVDLTRVPQSDYSGLGQGDRIIVSGTLSQDDNYLRGLSIERVRSDYQAP
jgi:hypothetical protein